MHGHSRAEARNLSLHAAAMAKLQIDPLDVADRKRLRATAERL